MKDENEGKLMTDESRQWIAPEFTELNAGATAGGPVPNTEAYNYRPS